MNAIILAAGEGKRLRPLTNDKPKCLVELFGKTLLEWQLSVFKKCGINDICVVTGYNSQMFRYTNLDYIKNEKYFLFTYGDGVSDIDITASVKFHRQHGKMATLTATFSPGRFGALEIKEKIVESFQEKPRGDGALINGGFFVLSPKALNYIEDNNTVWEQEPLKTLAENGELMAFQHPGFWQPLDTLRDKNYLEELWAKGKAPWKLWQ